jgi:hypothetical protein
MNSIKEIEEIIGQAIGEASMLWSETPKGVFESMKAVELIKQTTAKILTVTSNQFVEAMAMREGKA